VNLLAHAFLAADTCSGWEEISSPIGSSGSAPNIRHTQADARGAILIGNVFGDQFKGDLSAVHDSSLRFGVEMHRRIDSFTDRHELVAAGRSLFTPDTRRFAGILVDVMFDHYLAANWDTHAPVAFASFAERVYADAERHLDLLPTRGQRIASSMCENDWLGRYRHLSGVVETLERLSRRPARSSRRAALPFAGLAEFGRQLDSVYEPLGKCFDGYFPLLREYARGLDPC
jgi:acyl carrier protein phosphodiesterase